MERNEFEEAKNFLRKLKIKMENAKIFNAFEENLYLPIVELNTAIYCIDRVQELEKQNAELRKQVSLLTESSNDEDEEYQR